MEGCSGLDARRGSCASRQFARLWGAFGRGATPDTRYGCADLPVANETHAYPWLASCVALSFLLAIGGLYFFIGVLLIDEIVRVRPGPAGGG